MSESAHGEQHEIIDSWKGIAAFLGRDERTVQRWEKQRGLPVHRIPGSHGAVFAIKVELLDWMRPHADEPVESSPAPKTETIEDAPTYSETTVDRVAPAHLIPDVAPWRKHAILLSVSAALLGGLSVYLIHRTWHKAPAATPAVSATTHTPPKAARDLYLEGHAAWNKRTSTSLQAARQDFEEALRIDPQYADAYAGLAQVYALLPEFSFAPAQESFAKTVTYAQRAVELNPDLADGHRALAFGLIYNTWDTSRALAEFDRAVQLAPNDAQTHHWYATAQFSLRRLPEARREIEIAQKLNPESRSVRADGDLIHTYFSETHDEAVHGLQHMAATEPDFISPVRYLSYVYYDAAQWPQYIDMLHRIAAISHKPDDATLADTASRGFRKAGRQGLLEALASEYSRRAENNTGSAYDAGMTLIQLGRTADGIAMLRRSFDKRDLHLIFLRDNPAKVGSVELPLSNPDYQQLVEDIRRNVQ